MNNPTPPDPPSLPGIPQPGSASNANDIRCRSCHVLWSQDQWTKDCPECGGAAMEIACLICGGKCGRTWKRMLMDSWDESQAHWLGGCGLPEDEQKQIIEASRQS